MSSRPRCRSPSRIPAPGTIRAPPCWRLSTRQALQRRARRHDFLQRLQGDLARPVSSAKRFLFSIAPNQIYKPCRPGPKEGRIAIVTYVGLGCGGRGSVVAREHRRAGRRPVSDRPARGRTALKRTAKPCGPGTRCWCQAGGGFLGPTGSR
jgi:hypothetical protein